jgi:hypothetical protein
LSVEAFQKLNGREMSKSQGLAARPRLRGLTRPVSEPEVRREGLDEDVGGEVDVAPGHVEVHGQVGVAGKGGATFVRVAAAVGERAAKFIGAIEVARQGVAEEDVVRGRELADPGCVCGVARVG